MTSAGVVIDTYLKSFLPFGRQNGKGARCWASACSSGGLAGPAGGPRGGRPTYFYRSFARCNFFASGLRTVPKPSTISKLKLAGVRRAIRRNKCELWSCQCATRRCAGRDKTLTQFFGSYKTSSKSNVTQRRSRGVAGSHKL